MLDVSGNTIEVGDKVAYCVARYSSLKVGYVTRKTPNGVRVASCKTAKHGLFRYPDQISKITTSL